MRFHQRRSLSVRPPSSRASETTCSSTLTASLKRRKKESIPTWRKKLMRANTGPSGYPRRRRGQISIRMRLSSSRAWPKATSIPSRIRKGRCSYLQCWRMNNRKVRRSLSVNPPDNLHLRKYHNPPLNGLYRYRQGTLAHFSLKSTLIKTCQS